MTKQTLDNKTEISNETGLKIESKEKGESTYKTELKDLNLNVKSLGNDYKISFNGFEFSGNADLQFSNKENKSDVKTIYEKKYKYEYYNVYKHYNVTHYTYKSKLKQSESVRESIWLKVLIFLLGVAFIPSIKFLINKYNG